MPQFHLQRSFFQIVDGKYADVANGAYLTGQTYTFEIPFAMEGYRYLTIQMNIENTSVTFEATNDTNDIVQASATWTDVTQLIWGVVNRTATGDWVIDTPIPFARFRIKALTTNDTNSFQARICRSN